MRLIRLFNPWTSFFRFNELVCYSSLPPPFLSKTKKVVKTNVYRLRFENKSFYLFTFFYHASRKTFSFSRFVSFQKTYVKSLRKVFKIISNHMYLLFVKRNVKRHSSPTWGINLGPTNNDTNPKVMMSPLRTSDFLDVFSVSIPCLAIRQKKKRRNATFFFLKDSPIQVLLKGRKMIRIFLSFSPSLTPQNSRSTL